MKALIAAALSVLLTTAAWGADPLPSWNEGSAKQSVIAFVTRVTDPRAPDYAAGRAHRHIRQ